ncbi:unnamed protein product [Calypogeia fissa]
MASIRKSLYSGASSAVRFCKSSSSNISSHGAPAASGSIGVHCTPVSQTCGPKVNSSAIRNAFSHSGVPPTSMPFRTKSNISAPIPGSRCYMSQIARFPGELGATLSLIPYYSAMADSRLVSRLGASGDAAILQDNEDGT